MSEKKCNYLYKITHIKSNRIYIGIHSTDNIDDGYFGCGIFHKNGEWKKLNRGKYYGTHHIRNAFLKYGKNAFTRDIIKYFDSRDAALKEEKEIVNEEFINDKNTFNNRVGGSGGNFSKEVRKKISENNPMHRQDVRNKVSAAQKKIWTNDKKLKLSKNNPMKDPEVLKKMSGQNSVWFGRKHKEKSKKKISDANKGRIRTKDQIKSQSESLKKYWNNAERVSQRKIMKGVKKPIDFGKKLSDNWKDKIEIIDLKSKITYNSLKELKIALEKEGINRTIGTISEYVRGIKGKRSGLNKRFKYLKNPKTKKSVD